MRCAGTSTSPARDSLSGSSDCLVDNECRRAKQADRWCQQHGAMETMTVAAGGTPGQEAEAPPQVIVIGNLTIDNIVRENGTTFLRSLGGNTIHAATAARIWGVGVGAVARVGDDFPSAALARLQDAGVDTLGIHPISGPTLRFWILYGEDGGRTFVSGTP